MYTMYMYIYAHSCSTHMQICIYVPTSTSYMCSYVCISYYVTYLLLLFNLVIKDSKNFGTANNNVNIAV